jgi:hypothetical protein
MPGEMRVIKLSCNINAANTRVWEKGPSLATLLADGRARNELDLQSKPGLYQSKSNNDV